MSRALIIDDDDNNLGILQQSLSLMGVESTAVQDTQRLTDVLKISRGYDVVFLDLEMPGLNGYEVLSLLKGMPQFQQVPVVAYTVHLAEVNNARQLGFHSFIGKPLDIDTFPAYFNRILNGEPVWVLP